MWHYEQLALNMYVKYVTCIRIALRVRAYYIPSIIYVALRVHVKQRV